MWKKLCIQRRFSRKKVAFWFDLCYNTFSHRTFVTKFYPSEEVFGLPNIKSAKKRVLVNQTKAARNKAAKSALKTQLKYFDAAINEGNRSEADARYKAAVKAVDQAAARGLMHKNTAANRKSKMTLRLNKLPQ